MNNATQRSIFRRIHIIFSIPILGYIYSPFEKLPGYAPPTRYVFLPVMVLTGLWMWKGHVVRRLFSKRSAQQDAANNPWPAFGRLHTNVRRAHQPRLGGDGVAHSSPILA
jgi:hypothetical protein